MDKRVIINNIETNPDFEDKPLKSFPTSDPINDAAMINKTLEKLISRDISQYMWSLRLFQTRPKGQDYPYSK